MEYLDKYFWKNKKVFLTGHTGFKGSWLYYILKLCGAKVFGYSLLPNSKPSLFEQITDNENNSFNDINDKKELKKAITTFEPEIIFHLAAQPLVIPSYLNPYETFYTNIMGTTNLLNISRGSSSLKSIIIITSDKVYENREWNYGYRESDKLGGHDPYSASKAATEIIANSFKKSFLDEKNIILSTARAGNVIGGGDWAEYRLIPDLIRAVFEKKKLHIRSPNSTRPWQHVLEPIFGYLTLAKKTYLKEVFNDTSFNFGPYYDKQVTVKNIVENFISNLKSNSFNITYDDKNQFHETSYLNLSIDKSIDLLNWKPKLSIEECLYLTVNWYKNYYGGNNCKKLMDSDIEFYISK